MDWKKNQLQKLQKLKPFDRMKESALKKMFGFGLVPLIKQVGLGIASIQAGKTSIKLKNEIQNSVFKMSLSILLDSAIAKQQNKNQKSHDFVIRFDEPIVLDKNKNFIAALNEVVTMSYSWYNIRASYGNNTLRWKKNSESAWKTITFSDRMYNYDDLDSFIQKKIGKKDPTNDESADLFTLFFDGSIFRAVVVLDNSVEIDLSHGTFADLLGFEEKVLDQTTNISKNVPNITRGVDWVFIHCDLITREDQHVGSDVLFSFPTSTLNVSYSFSKEPRRLSWHPVNKHTIQAIRVHVTDRRNSLLDMNNFDLAISLYLKEEDKIHE